MLTKNREFLDRRSINSNHINDNSHNQSSMINTSDMDDVLSKVPFLNVQFIDNEATVDSQNTPKSNIRDIED